MYYTFQWGLCDMLIHCVALLNSKVEESDTKSANKERKISPIALNGTFHLFVFKIPMCLLKTVPHVPERPRPM